MASASESDASSSFSSMKPFTRFDLHNSIWDVPSRYTNLTPIGLGTFGQVCSAIDTTKIDTNKLRQQEQDNNTQQDPPYLLVAIKKLTRPLQSTIHAKRAYREIRLLKHMNHENVIGLFDLFTSSVSFQDFNEVYLVTHYMPVDLNKVIKAQRLSDEQIQFIVYQILRGLKYIHSAGIIHRDLKPSNLIVTEDCDLRIADFGLARCAESEMTGYVATRFYRAPEVMLNWMHYDQTVDIWSVGCIMAELITGKILFPGADHINHLERIFAVCGTPDEDFMKRITSEDALAYLKTIPAMKKKDLREVLQTQMLPASPEINPQAISLLDLILNLDPARRPTAGAILAHPYYAQFANPDDEPTCNQRFDDTFEETTLSLQEWKQLIWNEIEGWQEKPQQLPGRPEGMNE